MEISQRKNTALYFTTVAACTKDITVLGGHLYMEEDEPSITRLLVYRPNGWTHLLDFNDIVYATVCKPPTLDNPAGVLCVMGRRGNYIEFAGGSSVSVKLPGVEALYLMDLRWIDGALYACGVQNQVWRQEGTGWYRIDNGLFVPFSGRVDRVLNSIDGFASGDLYAVGNSGNVWHWNGSVWSQLEVPTDLHLNAVFCSKKGDVYIGGAKGVLLRGKVGHSWTVLTNPQVCSDSIENFSEFGEDIYAAGTTRLLKVNSAGITSVNIPVKGEPAFYTLDSGIDSLWCVGNEIILRYDGSSWEQLICSENT